MTEQPPLQPLHPHRRGARRWIVRALLALAAAGGVAVLVRAWLPSPTTVEVATARVAPLEVTVDEDGKTRVRDRYAVAAPIAGELVRVELVAGATVEAGAILARIAPAIPPLLDARTREQVTAQLAAAVARERTATTMVARARAAHVLADREAARTRQLAATGATTATARDHDDLAAEVAAQEVSAAEAQVRAATADIAAARALLGDGRAPSNAVVVRAPVSGRVLKIVRESAGPIAAGAPILELGDPRALEGVVDVLSSDGARIRPGMPVALAGWGGDHELAGVVDRVEPSAFTKVSALGVDEQRVNVVVAIPDVPRELGDGFRVDARITLWRGNALTVPASAVFRERGRWAVYAVEDGRAHLRPVELGHLGHLDLEIAAGLAPGAEVILHPGDRVAEGARVRAGQ